MVLLRLMTLLCFLHDAIFLYRLLISCLLSLLIVASLLLLLRMLTLLNLIGLLLVWLNLALRLRTLL